MPQTFDEMLTPLKSKHFPYLTPRQNAPPGASWGQFVQPVSIARFTSIIRAKSIPNRSSRLTTFPRLFNCWPHKPPPPNAAVGYRGANCFSLCPFPDESTDVYRISCQSVHPFGSFPRLKCVTPKPLRNAPCGIEGRIVYSYVHSQTNPQACTKFGANRSSRLTAYLFYNVIFTQVYPISAQHCSPWDNASTDFWICYSLKCPLGYWRANCI